ncbi:acetyl-CoA carboxylase biotin carboxyl carrier protein [Sphingomonas piscis]|uniref:Biotin carboxyl carrier protein of acetyl-CoA carboxylase n=1 Tax=Sphingomonas piscis TaxID=2714943 RepID=A0A6G7YN00_9SPHN|nr:acetyl-CoA carboxylase biotin carboxyl carrier protein [Sphingomonas piscis]QIK78119.1 acetyl-CoA carboxylase biotin carboxyl carrier protein [Sphingomonas piscis]
MADREENGAMRIDPALVRELAELLTTNELTEIEVEDGDRKIKVVRNPAPVFAGAAPAPAPVAAAPAAAATPAASTAEAPASAEEASGETVKSPMVGTAFLAGQPGAKPFVSVGDAVKAGDTLLIVEAMKVMNPITAPNGGVVKKIMVADAQPVEYDQPLVVIG